MNGTKPSGGGIVIENGQVSTTGTSMNFGDHTVSYDTDKKTFVASEKVAVEILCTANTSKVSALVWGGNANPLDLSSYNSEEVGLLASCSNNYTPGVIYTCNVGTGERTFFVLEETGDNVSLILGTNLGSTVSWSSDGSNHKDEDESQQAVTAKAYLKEQTSRWIKLNQSQINLPTYDQIYKAAGNKSSDFSTWLNSYTDENMAYGYWTSTPNASNSTDVWVVYFNGSLYNNSPHEYQCSPCNHNFKNTIRIKFKRQSL